jgi:hypothetical protein
MTYLDDTMHIFEHFDDTCLHDEIDDHVADRLHGNEELIRPATRLQYIQIRMLYSIAKSLETIAAKPPF